MAPFDGKYLTFYLKTIVMFALSLINGEIFAKLIKCKSFDVENEGQGQGLEEQDLRHSAGNVRIQNFSYPAT